MLFNRHNFATRFRPRHIPFWRRYVVAGVILLIALGSRLSWAGFETPFIDTANGSANVEFRNVWAFDRATDVGGTVATTFNRYEAFAVGIDTTISDSTCGGNADDCNGAIFFFDGTSWSRVTTPFVAGVPPFAINAIVGQLDPSYGTLGVMWVVGQGGKMSKFTDYNYNIGTTIGSTINQFSAPITAKLPTPTVLTLKDFYAIDAVQEYNGKILAGGQYGLVAVTNGSSDPTLITIVSPDFPGASDNITGIRFATKDVAFVTTSTGPAPYEHNCPSGETSKLFRVDFTSSTNGSWNLVQSDSDNCFYGLTTALTDSFQPVVWVASEKGLYRCLVDATNTCTDSGVNWDRSPQTNGKPQYTAIAVSQRSGAGVNLLLNGDFETGNTNGWVRLGSFGNRYYQPVSGPCTPENTAGNNEISIQAGGPTGQFLQLINRAIYTNPTCASNSSNLNDGFTTGAYQTIPFSTIEGRRYKISGYYKVEFPNNTLPPPTKAQGGVVLTCAGSNVQTRADSIDCSVSNRKYVVVDDGSHVGTGGWVPFKIITSREDGIVGSFNRKGDLKVTKRKMDLQIRCEATYGATVSCDQLVVEEINTPSTPGRVAVTVISAGKEIAPLTSGPNMYINQDALNPDPLKSLAFQPEPVPNKVRLDSVAGITNQVNSMFAVGLQHVFAAGQALDTVNGNAPTGLAIYSRSPSNLQGSIWAGAYSPTSATDPAPAGVISVSCVDDRGTDGLQPTLCQRVPESYGMSLDITSATNATKTGVVIGQAWFGKPADTRESIDLGKCMYAPNPRLAAGYFTIRSGEVATPPLNICDYNYFNNSGSRRCRATNADGSISTTALTNVSCLTNFDCLGRCEQDNGFLCLNDDDCRVGPDVGIWFGSSGVLNTFPYNRLSCGTASSPLACTPAGWLSFNSSDFSPTPTPSGEPFGVRYNTLYTTPNVSVSHNQNYDLQNQGAHELSGWARFITFKNSASEIDPNTDTGWVSLRGDDIGASPAMINTRSSLLACRNCSGGAAGTFNCAFCQDAANHSCVPSSTNSQAACNNVCKGVPTTRCGTDAECGTNGPCVAPGFCSNTLTGTPQYCQKDDDCGTGNSCLVGAVCSSAGARCARYGVNLDTSTGKFMGYAWSQDFGWLSFSDVTYGGNRILQTKLGDIYATGQIGDDTVSLPPGGSSCNSTYLITSASSITGFCSASEDDIDGLPTIQRNSTRVPFLSAENTYQNVLGRLDLVGIEKDVEPVAAVIKKNKFGSTIVNLSANASNSISGDWQSKLITNGSPPTGKYLGGQVYVVGSAGSTTTYSLDSVMNFNNSDGAVGKPLSAAGVLIVNGNLTIGADMTYNANNVSISNDLRKLASLTVIVKGNLTISNAVQNIVGTYYVTGTIKTATDDVGTNQYPLTVRGLMIAKDFEFKRKFAGTIENPLPSELIIYDGRFQSNPMLGMTDFASSLPNTVSVGP